MKNILSSCAKFVSVIMLANLSISGAFASSIDSHINSMTTKTFRLEMGPFWYGGCILETPKIGFVVFDINLVGKYAHFYKKLAVEPRSPGTLSKSHNTLQFASEPKNNNQNPPSSTALLTLYNFSLERVHITCTTSPLA